MAGGKGKKASQGKGTSVNDSGALEREADVMGARAAAAADFSSVKAHGAGLEDHGTAAAKIGAAASTHGSAIALHGKGLENHGAALLGHEAWHVAQR